MKKMRCGIFCSSHKIFIRQLQYVCKPTYSLCYVLCCNTAVSALLENLITTVATYRLAHVLDSFHLLNLKCVSWYHNNSIKCEHGKVIGLAGVVGEFSSPPLSCHANGYHRYNVLMCFLWKNTRQQQHARKTVKKQNTGGHRKLKQK